MKKALWIILAAAGLLTGCASSGYSPPVYESTDPSSEAPMIIRDPDSPYLIPSTPAAGPQENVQVESTTPVDRLYASATSLINRADYEQASVELERAIRMAPRDPRLYVALAKVRLKQGDTAQAQQLCRRAETLAQQGDGTREECRQLLQLSG